VAHIAKAAWNRMSKLEKLAQLASEFYEIPLDKLRSRDGIAKYAIPRRVCIWLAVDAGYSKSAVARFWKLDRTTIYYSVQQYTKRLGSSKHEKSELIRFSQFVKKFLNDE
jgi:chromosomal replication initiation ATPase DnaA|tara:strand:- start:1026 stop:1355 length:330 start_codon:yes stop_codon:yes gene_type:complete